MITLITGGARSGKSNHSLELASSYKNKVFIATARVMDGEMEDRISKHKKERGNAFTTIEEPLDLAASLKNLPEETDLALIDCTTVWIGNLMFERENEEEPFIEINEFIEALISAPCDVIIVSNEVGMGIVPDNAMARKFRDIAGRLNQDIAKIAAKVILTVAGMPVQLK